MKRTTLITGFVELEYYVWLYYKQPLNDKKLQLQMIEKMHDCKTYLGFFMVGEVD